MWYLKRSLISQRIRQKYRINRMKNGLSMNIKEYKQISMANLLSIH